MSSRSEIRFNFRTAIKQAERLETSADQLKKLANASLETSLDTLSESWKGENAGAYSRKGVMQALRIASRRDY